MEQGQTLMTREPQCETPCTELDQPNESSTAKQPGWIDGLFRQFHLRYGTRFIDNWRGIDIFDVKLCWQQELEKYSRKTIWAAFKTLGNHPPSLPEFIDLCRAQKSTNASFAPALPPPKIDQNAPENKAARDIVFATTEKLSKNSTSYQWAYRLADRIKHGEILEASQMDCLRNFMKITGLNLEAA